VAVRLSVASLQVTIIGSQLRSSPLGDHYAVLLLLPVAWLVARGRTWAIVSSLRRLDSPFADVDQSAWAASAGVPLTFFGCLTIVLIEASVERRAQRSYAVAALAPK
jgi:hypothetical protein